MKVIELLSCLTFLAAITSGVEIQCDYQNSNWFLIGTLYTCTATVINEENAATITNITGTHLAGKENEDVEGFNMYDSHLTTIPTGIGYFFYNLEGFQWAYGNIYTLDSSTFEPFENLLSIQLGGNKLANLDTDLFQHTRKLREIRVHSNLLQHVGHDLLTGLTDLTLADFELNPCISVFAETPQEIEELNRQLPIQCPPLITTLDPPTTTISTTSEPNECPDTCTLNEEAQEMRERIDEIERRLSELE